MSLRDSGAYSYGYVYHPADKHRTELDDPAAIKELLPLVAAPLQLALGPELFFIPVSHTRIYAGCVSPIDAR